MNTISVSIFVDNANLTSEYLEFTVHLDVYTKISNGIISTIQSCLAKTLQ